MYEYAKSFGRYESKVDFFNLCGIECVKRESGVRARDICSVGLLSWPAFRADDTIVLRGRRYRWIGICQMNKIRRSID